MSREGRNVAYWLKKPPPAASLVTCVRQVFPLDLD